MITNFDPIKEEKKLKELQREAMKNRDRGILEKVSGQLVSLYVRYGEYFKMNEDPDPCLAKTYLKKALKLKEDHPIANYRMAHLFYREGDYFNALTHFYKAIDGSATEALNDTQLKLARMFVVNCGIFLAKESLEEIVESEEIGGDTIDDGLINKYRDEILADSVVSIEKMFYHVITATEDKIVSESLFQRMMEDKYTNGVLLGKDQLYFFIKYQDETIDSLHKTAFMVLYIILTTSKPLTNEEIVEQVYLKFRQDVSSDNIRQIFSRRNKSIPFLEQILEEGTVKSESGRNKSTRRLNPELSFTIMYRADENLFL
jgi:tetratricopeptide (TPR) repeat protein